MNQLYYGDNLAVMRNCIGDESIDLIYLDPPFNSQATYNVLFRSLTGEQSKAQIEAFEDTWHWTDEAEKAFDEVMTSGNTDAAEMLRAMRSFLRAGATRRRQWRRSICKAAFGIRKGMTALSTSPSVH